MVKYIQITLSILLMMFLSGCGFEPLLAKKNEDYRLLEKVKINKIEGESSVKIREIIHEAFGNSEDPTYFLNINVKYENSAMAILKDTQTTRYRVKITLNYNLVNISNNKIFNSGSLYIYNSYDVAYSEFMNYTSNQYVGELGIRELCSELKTRLISILSREKRSAQK